jgi:hypothetical protein
MNARDRALARDFDSQTEKFERAHMRNDPVAPTRLFHPDAQRSGPSYSIPIAIRGLSAADSSMPVAG